MTASLQDIADLVKLMPRAVDVVHHGAAVHQTDENGAVLPKPVLHFACALEDRQAAREFLQDHGDKIACYRLDPRDKGMLMVGMADDGEAKRIAREELNREVPEGLFGQRA